MHFHNSPIKEIEIALIDINSKKDKETLANEFVDELMKDKDKAEEYLSIPVWVHLKEDGRYSCKSVDTIVLARRLNKKNILAHISNIEEYNRKEIQGNSKYERTCESMFISCNGEKIIISAPEDVGYKVYLEKERAQELLETLEKLIQELE